MINPNKWELWFADVYFEDNPTISKKRPVLVLSRTEAIVLCNKITSHAPRLNCQGEYQLKDWKNAGLLKPSTIRLSQRFKLNIDKFIFKIGRLSSSDVLAIIDELNNL